MERNILISLLVVVAACSCPANAIAAQFKAAKYYHTGQDPYQAVTADFNHDGNTDLAFADWLSNQVVVVLGKGDGTFQKPHIFSLGSAGALVSGDLNEDGNTDWAVAQFGGTGHGQLALFFGDGKGGFRAGPTYQLGVSTGLMAIGDVNNDGHLDIVVADQGPQRGTGDVMVFLGNGKGKMGKPAIYKLGNTPVAVAIGNLNVGGFTDLVVTQAASGSVAVFFNDGTGHFKKPVTYNAGGGEVVDVKIAALRHDGRNDLVIANGSLSAVGVLLNTGDGTFGEVTLYPTHCDVEALTVADFNLDGKLDVAVAAQAGNSAFMYGKGNGTFGSPVPIKDAYGNNNYGGFSIASGDFNNDGAPDLAIPIQNAGKVAIMLNTQ